MDFKQFSRSAIDEAKWNNRIEYSDYPHAYGTTSFLDIACPNGWEALVWGDYDAVMPFPLGRVLIYHQTFTPFWIQQLGVFKKEGFSIDKELLQAFLLKKYRLFDCCVFDASDFKKEWIQQERLNFELPLDENRKANYSKNLKRLIKKAEKSELKWEESTDINTLIQFFRENKGVQINAYKDQDYTRLQRLIEQDVHKGEGIVLQVKSEGVIVAMAFFQIAFGRASYLLGTSNEEGRGQGAMQFLLDAFISNYHKNLSILDFEGSMIPGIQRFVKSFGAKPKTYFRVKFNRLPFPLNKLKK